MRKRLCALGLAAGISALCPQAVADDYDPLDTKAVLAKAEKELIKQGSSALTDVGKGLLGAALNAYAPGLGSLLGLSGGDTSTKQVLDAIAADGNKTRDLVEDFWAWSRAQQVAQVQAEYATVEWEISSWELLAPRHRIDNRSNLDMIVTDCVNIMTKFQFEPVALGRTGYLHAYLTLMNLTISLEAQRTELQILGSEIPSNVDPVDWWEGLSESERNAIVEDIQSTKQQRVENLLLSGLAVSFEDHLAAIDAGTLPGGTPGMSDFEVGRDWQFSNIAFGYPPNGGSDGSSRWFYFLGYNDDADPNPNDLDVDFDPLPHCPHKEQYCDAYTIVQGAFNTGVNKYYYWLDFDDGSGSYHRPYDSPHVAYEHHRELVLQDMIVRGYGPARAFAEAWWETWGLGDRNRLGLDDYIDSYLEAADDVNGGALQMLGDWQTKSITPGEKSRLYGFALQHGLDAVEEITDIVFDNRDYMTHNITERYRFPWSVHREVLQAYPASAEVLSKGYRAVPVSKVAAAVL
jgi:hypothetical protein